MKLAAIGVIVVVNDKDGGDGDEEDDDFDDLTMSLMFVLLLKLLPMTVFFSPHIEQLFMLSLYHLCSVRFIYCIKNIAAFL